jgi:hypothetical protein
MLWEVLMYYPTNKSINKIEKGQMIIQDRNKREGEGNLAAGKRNGREQAGVKRRAGNKGARGNRETSGMVMVQRDLQCTR